MRTQAAARIIWSMPVRSSLLKAAIAGNSQSPARNTNHCGRARPGTGLAQALAALSAARSPVQTRVRFSGSGT